MRAYTATPAPAESTSSGANWPLILLLVVRCIQGIAVGGEYGSTATYMSEIAQPGRRGQGRTPDRGDPGHRAVALALLFIVKARAQSLPRGFGRAYNAGFVTTMTLYASCIAWVFGHQDPWPSATVVVILSAVVALPCLVAATVVHRLGRR